MSRKRLEESRDARNAFFATEGERLAQVVQEGQRPHTLFIGCSDSRVMAESLTDAHPGDLFVVRNVANIVPPYRTGGYSVAAPVEFAVRKLGVSEIIVCGHTDCGGVRALDMDLDAAGLPDIAEWIGHARPVVDRVNARNVSDEARHMALVEENVLLQLERLRAYPAAAEGLANGTLRIHGWVFDLHTQTIRYLDHDSDRFIPFDDR